jgi:ubiquitin-conjugating enzyme E2 J1
MSVRSATLKRLLKERQMMETSPCREFTAEMLKDNALEWHFTMLGPADTPYAEGYYHGKILVPADYPFKPPDVVLLTPNGRFELDKRICLSISSYHPENWHPTWGIATVLHALREFMATPGNRAIGAIEYPKAVREDLAQKSVVFTCPVCGCHIADVKEKMLAAPAAADSDKEVIPATPLGGPASPPTSSPQSREPSMDMMTLPPAEASPDAILSPPMAESSFDGASPRQAECPADSPPNRNDADDAHQLADAVEEEPAAVPVAVPPAALRLPPPRVIEHRNGEVIINVSIHTIDRSIHTVLILIAVLLAKKALFDYGSTIATHVLAWV